MIVQEALKLGAYDLKKYANKNLAIGFGISTTMMLVLLLGGGTLAGAGSGADADTTTFSGPVTLEDFLEEQEPPEVTEETPPVEPLTPPPPPPAAAVEQDLGTGSQGAMGDLELSATEVDGPEIADMSEVSFADTEGGGDGGISDDFGDDFEIEDDVDLSAKDENPIAEEPGYVDGFIADGKKATYSLGQLKGNIDYPTLERELGEEGSVTLKVWLSKTGNIDKVEVLRGSGNFVDAARKAVKKTTFTPATQHGHAIRSKLIVKVDFKLK